MAFGDIFNSQQNKDTDQTVIDQVPIDVVVILIDTHLLIPYAYCRSSDGTILP
jgi:hypothetical protein